MRHHAEATRCELQQERRRDQVPLRERDHGVQRHGPRPLDQRGESGEETVHVALVQREQQLFLAREVEVDGALGEPGRVGHVGDTRHAVGRPRQQGQRRVEQRVVSLLLVFGVNRALPDHHGDRYPSLNDQRSFDLKA
jgi:hypothetical protein